MHDPIFALILQFSVVFVVGTIILFYAFLVASLSVWGLLQLLSKSVMALKQDVHSQLNVTASSMQSKAKTKVLRGA